MGSVTEKTTLTCDHCLLPVSESEAVYDDQPSGRTVFCCHACRAIYRMINEEGLGDFYRRRDWSTRGIPETLRVADPAAAGAQALDVREEAAALVPFIRGEGDIKEAELMIDGIRCASCVWLNEKVLERTNGVLSARVNFATHRARVTWDSSIITLAAIIARMCSIGYLASPYTPAAQEEFLRKQNHDLLIRLGTAAFFSMQLMLFSFGLYAGFFQGIEPGMKRWLSFAAFLVCTPVLFYSGWPFLSGAIRGVRNRALNMDVLVSLGALSAYLLSVRHMLSGGEVYFDTSAMIITLVLLGRFLENSAKQTASQAVGRLLALQPREARVIRESVRVLVSTDDVTKGDVLEIRAGEKIPLDGIIEHGVTEVDEALVTGESKPVEKSPGSEIIGGTMNGLGTITVRVTRIGQETTLSRIAQLVESAQAAGAPIQRIADRVSAYFIPFVLSLAAVTLFYWSRQAGPGDSATAVMNAVSVLVIACPCALGLATPVAILAGTGRAARSGILIKGGDVLEGMHRVRTVVMDKTGTLTTGKMDVKEVQGQGSRGKGQGAGGKAQSTEKDILQIAASAEQGSEHLLGAAIVKHAKEQEIPLLPSESFHAVPGMGMKAMVEGKHVLVGKQALLEGEGVNVHPEIISQAHSLEAEGRTVVYVACGSELLGLITLMDSPRTDAGEAVRQLKGMGISVIMITGDNESTAQAIGKSTGIDRVLSEVLPSGKAEEVEKLRAEGGRVAMVGDGINDAPALAAADVGMAMSAGSDIAIESADVVLMRSTLLSVAEAFTVAGRTFRIIKQNLFWAFFYNVAALPLAMTGVLSPIVAAGAMAMSSVTVVMNSLRLRT